MVFGFKKNRNKRTNKNGPVKFNIDVDFTTLMILVVMSLVIVQALGLLFEPFIDINLGPTFVLIAVGMSAATSMAVFKKLFTNTDITRRDIFAIIVVALLSLVMLFFLRDFIPEIFEQGVVALQSMVGF